MKKITKKTQCFAGKYFATLEQLFSGIAVKYDKIG